MGVFIGAKIEGAQALFQNLQQIDSDLRRVAIPEILGRWGDALEHELEMRVPVKEGVLKQTIRSGKINIWPDGNGASILTGLWAEDYRGKVFYAAMVEYGHGAGIRPSRKRVGGTWQYVYNDEGKRIGRRKVGGVIQTDQRKRVQPHPFARPALEAVIPKLIPIAEDVLLDVYANAGRAA